MKKRIKNCKEPGKGNEEGQQERMNSTKESGAEYKHEHTVSLLSLTRLFKWCKTMVCN